MPRLVFGFWSETRSLSLVLFPMWLFPQRCALLGRAELHREFRRPLGSSRAESNKARDTYPRRVRSSNSAVPLDFRPKNQTPSEQLTSEERALTSTTGLTCLIHQSLYSGFTLVVMPKFVLEDFCRFIQELKITFAYVVPPVVLLLAKSPVVDNYDLSSIRMMNSGAAPLTKELVEALYARLKIPVKQGYGLSETSPTTHTQPWEDWNTTIGSVGTLLPYQTAKYMAEDGTEVPVGQVGELWIKGPNVFKGYLNNPEGTAHAKTADGYFKTGDVGYQDKNGHFYITDRVKELIKYKGFQVPPAELEGILASHPSINDVAVIGVYDKDQASELPRAYVVPAGGLGKGEKEAKEIVEWLNSRVANHKKLRGGVRFVDEIPKSVSGKILRRLLKEKALKEESEAVKTKL